MNVKPKSPTLPTGTRSALCVVHCALCIPVLLLAACSSEPTHRDVTRVDPTVVLDEDYRFDDEDARQVVYAMSDDANYRGWIDRWVADHDGHRPRLIVGSITNNTQDYINTNLFTRGIERELLNTGRVRVAAVRNQRGEIRDERLQGEEWNSPETRLVMRNELGANLILMGDVNDVVERSIDGRSIVKFYQVNLDLINLETNEKVWIGTHEIKKAVRIR